jgi:hypothetical protein
MQQPALHPDNLERMKRDSRLTPTLHAHYCDSARSHSSSWMNTAHSKSHHASNRTCAEDNFNGANFPKLPSLHRSDRPWSLIRLHSSENREHEGSRGQEADRSHGQMHGEDNHQHVAQVEHHREAMHGGQTVVKENEGVDDSVECNRPSPMERPPPPLVVLGTQLHIPACAVELFSNMDMLL